MLNQRIPQRVGRFEILEPMRPTTCGTLCRACAAGDDREFTLLLANDAATGASPAASSFYARAHKTARFSHVNVARILEIDKADGVTFVACELPPGRGLDTLRERGAPGREDALHILAQLATALDTAHEAGLFHGSLTPAEVWIGPNPAGTDRWHVTLLGLGISWLNGGAAERDLADQEYLAPERRNPDRWAEVGAASDIYSYAAIAWQLLSLHMSDFGLNPTLTDLQKVLASALADDPRMRPVRADAVFAEIRSALAPSTISLLPGSSEVRDGGVIQPAAQIVGLSVIAIMLVIIALLAKQRLFPRLNAGSVGNVSPTDDPPSIQIAQSTQAAQTGSAVMPFLNTPIDPTNTPEPSATPTATATSRPTTTRTPKLALTPTSTPTKVNPTAAFVPTPNRSAVAVRTTVRVAVAPSLNSPSTDTTAHDRMTFTWIWTGPALTSNQGFEVRLWKEGQPDHYGAAEPVRSASATFDVKGAYGVQLGGTGEYLWTVAVVQLNPYERIGSEATPRSLRIQLQGSSSATPSCVGPGCSDQP